MFDDELWTRFLNVPFIQLSFFFDRKIVQYVSKQCHFTMVCYVKGISAKNEKCGAGSKGGGSRAPPPPPVHPPPPLFNMTFLFCIKRLGERKLFGTTYWCRFTNMIDVSCGTFCCELLVILSLIVSSMHRCFSCICCSYKYINYTNMINQLPFIRTCTHHKKISKI